MYAFAEGWNYRVETIHDGVKNIRLTEPPASNWANPTQSNGQVHIYGREAGGKDTWHTFRLDALKSHGVQPTFSKESLHPSEEARKQWEAQQ